MNGRVCYERFVAAMSGKYELPPFGELDEFEKSAWDAVANPNSPRKSGSRRGPMLKAMADPLPAPVDSKGDGEPEGSEGAVR